MDPGLVACIRAGTGHSAETYLAMRARKLSYVERQHRFMAEWDLLLTPVGLRRRLFRRSSATRTLAATPLGLALVGRVLLPLQHERPPGAERAVRANAEQSARRLADRGQARRGPAGAAGGGNIRARKPRRLPAINA